VVKRSLSIIRICTLDKILLDCWFHRTPGSQPRTQECK